MEPKAGAIGWVYPGAIDRTVEDFFRMTPSDVNLVMYTRAWALKMMHGGAFDREAFAARTDEIVETATELLAYKDVDCLVVTGDLIQAAMGPEWVDGLRQRLESETGKPATTAMGAVTDALHHLGAKRIAVSTPWREDQNEHVKSYLEAVGLTVETIQGIETTTPNDVLELDPETAYSIPLEVYRRNPDVDALYVACPLWRGASDAIERLEQETGIPVLAFFNPVLWKCLRLMGYSKPVTGFGRLLAEESSEALAGAR